MDFGPARQSPQKILAKVVPSTVNLPSNRWEVRRIRQTGETQFQGARLFVSTALAGEAVGLVEIDEGIWRVYDRNSVLCFVNTRLETPTIACVQRKFEFLDGSRASQTTTLSGCNAVQVRPASPGTVDLNELATRLAVHGAFTVESGRLRVELRGEPTGKGGCYELTLFEDGRAIVRGSTEPSDARRIYTRCVGL